jgi:LysR family hca operon transcriptional activator
LLPADHPATALEKVRLADLANTPFLQIEPLHAGGLFNIIDNYIRSQGQELRRAQNVENVLTLMSLVSMGQGFSILPDYAEQLVFRNVAMRPFVGVTPAIDLAMVWRRDNDFEEVRAFRDLVACGHSEGRY